MKKINQILFFAIVFFILSACTRDDNNLPGSETEVDINEGQQNWQKKALSDCKPGGQSLFAASETGIVTFYGAHSILFINHASVNPIVELFQSSNSGQSWSKLFSINGECKASSALDSSVALVFFNGQQTQLLLSDDLLSEFQWISIPYHFDNIQFCNDSILLAKSPAGFYRSNNKGITWNMIKSGSFSLWNRFSTSKYYAIQETNVVSSNDTCKTWNTQWTTPNEVTALWLNPDSSALIGTSRGEIFKATHASTTPVLKFSLLNSFPLASSAKLSDIRMIDALNGFALFESSIPFNAGRDFDNTVGLIYRTVDGGESWSLSYRSQMLRFSKLISLDGPVVVSLARQSASESLGKVYICITKTLGV